MPSSYLFHRGVGAGHARPTAVTRRGTPSPAAEPRAGSTGGPASGRSVVARGDIVRRVGVEERRQELDLAAAGAELPLPAAIGADPTLLAGLVRREEPLKTEPKRDGLTHRPRRPAQALDVVDRVDNASQVTRSRCGSSTGSVSSVVGILDQACGSPSATRRYRAASAGVSTVVPRYWPLRSIESTAPSPPARRRTRRSTPSSRRA